MAEIKSTLELVMQRTRHLHMSEEEKQKQVEKEFAEAVNRLVSKHLDGQMSLDRFNRELNRLGEMDCARKMRAAAEISMRIDPVADNSALLKLIEDGLGLEVSGMEAALKQFDERLHREKDRTVERTRTDLLNKGVSGAAVIPNVEADVEWQKRRREMIDTLREELAARFDRCE